MGGEQAYENKDWYSIDNTVATFNMLWNVIKDQKGLTINIVENYE